MVRGNCIASGVLREWHACLLFSEVDAKGKMT